MFSEATLQYFEDLPRLPGADAQEIRAALSAAYADILAHLLDGHSHHAGPDVLLRRLVDALSLYVLTRNPNEETSRNAAAFVAAEALDLFLKRLPHDHEPSSSTHLPKTALVAAEAALLYVIAGHDSNASIVANGLGAGKFGMAVGPAASANNRLLASIESLCRGAVVQDTLTSDSAAPESSHDAAADAIAIAIAASIDTYGRWLRDLANPTSVDEALRQLLRTTTALEQIPTHFADLLHLATLTEAAIQSSRGRALRAIPRPLSDTPNGARFEEYVQARAQARPLLWPPAREFARHCLPGPKAHAVVTMPTGSGKGAVGEIATAAGALTGWVLYLVPTNALANQVRQDLRQAFATVDFYKVQAFLGGQEYTTLELEGTPPTPPGTVVVMTPEKCALALRRAPEAFPHLRALIIDECHLVGETGTRGVTAELVTAHILALNPETTVLMLSALVANPDHLRDWLEAVTARDAISIRSPWRPTRTLRGVVGLSREASEEPANDAANQLSQMPPRRKRVRFQAPLRVMVSLQGVWASAEPADFTLIDLPVSARLDVKREMVRGEAQYAIDRPSEYVSATAAKLSHHLISRGLKTLTFSPRSRHDPFVLARRVIENADGSARDATVPPIVQAQLVCAEYELGVESEVGALLRAGIAVHSSALLDPERHAAEYAFSHADIPLMIATGTLAQGLNLPAEVVVVAGTTMGDRSSQTSRDADRIRTQLLNAIGRAGRAAISNRGSAFVIPGNYLFFAAEVDPGPAESAVEFLAHEDASTTITSQLKSFVRNVLDGDIVASGLSIEEMTAYTYVPGTLDTVPAAEIFSKTLGMWEVAQVTEIERASRRVASSLQDIGQRFVRSANVPDWTREVAYKSGIPLPIIFEFYRAYQHRVAAYYDNAPMSMVDWSTELLRILYLMTPRSSVYALWAMGDMLAGHILGIASTAFAGTADLDATLAERRGAWVSLNGFVTSYIRGASLREVAQLALPHIETISHERGNGKNPIPKAIAITRQIQDRLALLGGALAAFIEVDEVRVSDELPQGSLWALERLPLALRNGCGTPGSLAWFRFGIKYRRPAHLLSRAFPVPDALSDDETAAFVRRRRRDWLSDVSLPSRDLTDEEVDVLTAIRQVLTG